MVRRLELYDAKFFYKGKDLTASKEFNWKILEDYPNCVTYATKNHSFYRV